MSAPNGLAGYYEAEAISSAWSPLQYAVFRSLWIAGLILDLGAWMHQVGEAWLMTSLSPSPLLVEKAERERRAKAAEERG
jgi:hypothetical protein